MGASALVVAAAFAVAFAVLVSSSTPAEAGDPDSDTNVHVGDIIKLTATAVDGGAVTFKVVTGTGANVKGVFKDSRTGTIECRPDRVEGTGDDAELIDERCDVGTLDANDDDTADDPDDGIVTVEFVVGAGTTNGHTLDVSVDFTATTPDDDSDTDTNPQPTDITDISGTMLYDHSHSVDGNAGDTVTVTFDLSTEGAHNLATQADPPAAGPGDGDFYQISDSSVGSATFASNGQSSIDCPDSDKGTGCDIDKDDDEVGLRIAIAEDSARGKIIVERYERVRGGDPLFRDSIDVNVVSTAVPVATLTLKAALLSIAADGGSTTLTVTMQKGNGDPAAGQSVTLITTRGNFGNDEQLQKVTTDATGKATATFRGGKVGGEATITATSGDLTKTVTITLHSGPDAIAVAVDDSTIQAEGAKTFIVVTVTDADGNAVGAEDPTVASVKGPNDLATQVEYDLNVDRNLPGTANDIPACGDDTSTGDDATSISATTAGGTNKDGKCVISVTAPRGATAGAHTVNVTLARLPKAALKAAATVEVVGKPKSLTIAAPDTVEPRGEADITITVYDEAGNTAAKNTVTLRKIEGQGLLEPEMKDTKNGVAAFKFFAPTSGAVVISASVGSGSGLVREFHTIAIAAEEPEEPVMPEEPDEPSMPDPTPTLTIQHNQGSFSGGSLEEFAAAAAAECPGGSQIAVQDADGDWKVWSSTAPPFANIGFTTAFAAGFDGLTFVWITSCEADAMENEG